MKLFISLSRSIANEDSVLGRLEFLKMDQKPNIQKWVDVTLRNYLRSDKNDLKFVKLVGDKEWKELSTSQQIKFQKAYEAKTLYVAHFGTAFGNFKQDLEHAIAYLQEHYKERSIPITVPDAIKKGAERLERINKKLNSAENVSDLKIVFRNGKYFVAELQTLAQIDREGRLTGTCIADDKQPHKNNILTGVIKAWSVRDPSNMPMGNIEYNVEKKKIVQIKGRQNGAISDPKAQDTMLKFFEHLQKKNLIDEFDSNELKNVGIIVDDKGKWWDLHLLPKNFVWDSSEPLDLSGLNVTVPEGLTVRYNDVDLSSTTVKELHHCRADFDVRLDKSDIVSVKDCKIGNLYLLDCKHLKDIVGCVSRGELNARGSSLQSISGCTFENIFLNRTPVKTINLCKSSTLDAGGCHELKDVTNCISDLLNLSGCTNLELLDGCQVENLDIRDCKLKKITNTEVRESILMSKDMKVEMSKELHAKIILV